MCHQQIEKLAAVLLCEIWTHSWSVTWGVRKPCPGRKRPPLVQKHLWQPFEERAVQRFAGNPFPRLSVWFLGFYSTQQAWRKGAPWGKGVSHPPFFFQPLKCPLGHHTTAPSVRDRHVPPPVPAFDKNHSKCPCCPQQTWTPNIWPELGEISYSLQNIKINNSDNPFLIARGLKKL